MFVIYKENNLPGVGGVHPQGISIGMAYYKGWNLANCPDDKIHYYKEFDFISVSPQVANGLQLLDSTIIEDAEQRRDEITGNMGAPISSVIVTTFSEKDKEDMDVAQKFINNIELKIITRAKVREIKDVEDDLVDLKRLVHSLITFVVDDWRVKSTVDKEKSRFKIVLDELSSLATENINALTTISHDIQKIEEIVNAEVEIAKVVDSYYLTKKL